MFNRHTLFLLRVLGHLFMQLCEIFGLGCLKRIGAPAHWVAAWRSRATLIPPPGVLDRIQEIIWEWHALYKEVKSQSHQVCGEDAEKWMHASSPALGKRSPHQLRKTSSGLQRVLDLLRKSPSNRDHL